jgi:hypothetical protein
LAAAEPGQEAWRERHKGACGPRGRGKGERERRRCSGPFSKRHSGDLRGGVRPRDEARSGGAKGGGADRGGSWRRKGGPTMAPTQARQRWAASLAKTRDGDPTRMGHCGVVGRLLADVGQSRENGEMGPAQEAQCCFHNYSFFSKRIKLI